MNIFFFGERKKIEEKLNKKFLKEDQQDAQEQQQQQREPAQPPVTNVKKPEVSLSHLFFKFSEIV